MRLAFRMSALCVGFVLLVSCSRAASTTAGGGGAGAGLVGSSTSLGARPGQPGQPDVVAGGAGPVATGSAASFPALPTISTAPGEKPAVSSTTLVRNPSVTTVRPGGAGPTTTLLKPRDTDPNLPLWCPLAQELVQILGEPNPTPEMATRMPVLAQRSVEVAPAEVKPHEVHFLEMASKMAESGRLDSAHGIDDARKLADDVLGPGGFDAFWGEMVFIFQYYSANCWGL